MKNFKFKINGTDYSVDINEAEGQEIKLDVNGTSYVVTLDKEVKKKAAPAPRPAARAAAPAAAAPAATSGASAKITTPLPGTILDVFVNVGDAVQEGQRVALLEAMKMENNINADRDGKIVSVHIKKGDTVADGAALAVIE